MNAKCVRGLRRSPLSPFAHFINANRNTFDFRSINLTQISASLQPSARPAAPKINMQRGEGRSIEPIAASAPSARPIWRQGEIAGGARKARGTEHLQRRLPIDFGGEKLSVPTVQVIKGASLHPLRRKFSKTRHFQAKFSGKNQ